LARDIRAVKLTAIVGRLHTSDASVVQLQFVRGAGSDTTKAAAPRSAESARSEDIVECIATSRTRRGLLRVQIHTSSASCSSVVRETTCGTGTSGH